VKPFLPVTKKDCALRGWDQLDVILITGDAYVDHPSFGASVIGRVLEAAGLKVGIIAQPDWRRPDDFGGLGRPGLFFGITAGNLDSMVANYTAHKRPRKKDLYSPGGKPAMRPDRATIVYANRVREVFGDIPIVLGGIEASLRRFAHYDWWDNGVRRSILVDSRADILVYGMGESQVREIAHRLRQGRDLAGIRGTTIIRKDPTLLHEAVEIPDLEVVKGDKDSFNRAFRLIYENMDPYRGKTIVQKQDTRYVVQFPPAMPLETDQLDGIYGLPYARRAHPSYDRWAGIPALETVRFSITSHRGCCGECSFCSLSLHQGRIVQSRSPESLVAEAATISQGDDFRGTITDVGGPTANLYGASCGRWEKKGACAHKHCLLPATCDNLRLGYNESLRVYREILALPGVKHVFVESGMRHDLLVGKEAKEYLVAVCKRHVTGRMKVAPEHISDGVLRLMNKPSLAVYEAFVEAFREANVRVGKEQFLVNYFISAHPGATLEASLDLALYLRQRNINPEQIQDFIPLPGTRSGAMYYTGRDPSTGKEVYVARTFQERKMQRALLQSFMPANEPLVREALHVMKKDHFLGRLINTRRTKSHHGT
jgi:uncharacterized radical SAM protein YgiQ